ncbi:MAG: 1-(5-phosphoribosyl)-5-[(5-phosphoribosylamino)methylideneamino]imidazole-4-carboxamide isomerase [Edaphocola sp.]
MKIIPAIDILNGKCVRLTGGQYGTEKVYNENPLDVARQMEDHGFQYLHVVDLDGARSRHIVNYKALEQICSHTHLQVDFGGGIKSTGDIMVAFESGAKQITAGSVAVGNPQLFLGWLRQFGAEKIILGADCQNRKIATHGWQQQSDLDVATFIEDYYQKGIRNVVCTDIARDGMLTGAATDLYKEILAATPVNLIASGGISSMDDVMAVAEAGCSAVIIGTAIYEEKISLKELTDYVEKEDNSLS